MARRRRVANPLALAVLAWLMTGPMHPYELGRRLQETGMDRSVKFNRGSLYMVVEQLRKAGFVAEQETVRDSQRPERTVYALTDDGRTELYDWMRELVAEPQHEYLQFATESRVGWIFLIEEEYRLTVLEAESAFVTELMKSLQQPEYVREWQTSFGRLP